MAALREKKARDTWGSRIGVVLAAAGCAIGLGNFLRFPGVAARNGGGAFMIPYFIAFVFLALPLCWMEWSMGRYGGRFGHGSAPGVFDAVGDRIEVQLDGGVRSGQDLLRALALGARGCHVGRAFLYGLGALGEAGVTRCLEILHKELDVTMGLCGRTRIDQVGRDILLPGSYPGSS